jgi:hypothetical protein
MSKWWKGMRRRVEGLTSEQDLNVAKISTTSVKELEVEVEC